MLLFIENPVKGNGTEDVNYEVTLDIILPNEEQMIVNLIFFV